MRTHFCGAIDESLTGQTVRLCGWVNKTRVQSHVVFIDLRDHEGVAQVVVEKEDAEAFALASGLGLEDCLQVSGTVRERLSANDKLKTGRVELLAESLQVLSEAQNLPFALHENPSEEMRLTYRYLDLRRPEMQRKMRTRSSLVRAIRSHLDGQGFQDIETPILTKATPEGARDYLVPSRLHEGEFFALPQSPQLFKQLLMMAGFDRYYQIARCFRDEDLRADRQPEFTQLDIECAFVTEADVQAMAENLVVEVFREVIGVALPQPFPRMSWREAMQRYGSDKPDLRVDMQLVDVDEAVKGLDFKVFSGPAADADGRVAALRVPGAADMSRKQLDELAAHAGKYGGKGLAWMKINQLADGLEGIKSPVARFLDADALAAIVDATAAADGDLLLFGAGDWQLVSTFMGAVRLRVAQDRGLVGEGWKPLWVTDFPMFEFDEDAGRLVALHHPFTAPAVADPEALRGNPGEALSRAYDMVLNGNEIGGGSIRIHRAAMQRTVLELLGIGEAEAEAKFGFLLKALTMGAPPHGGIAFGIDRIAALMAGTDSIRDVIAFPKTTSAQDLMTAAPSAVSDSQLDELHIAIRATAPDDD